MKPVLERGALRCEIRDDVDPEAAERTVPER